MTDAVQQLYRKAFALAIVTVVYNLAEGCVAIIFGRSDESLALFGFGVDSIIEVISGLGIAHMILRIRREPESARDRFERTALRITGGAFYALTAGLLITAASNVFTGQKPETTVVGVILSLLSIGAMTALMRAKLAVGTALRSDPIIADAHCTRVCLWMSLVLLVSSGIYELTHIAVVDELGSLALAWLSFNEGRESFAKARSTAVCACAHD